MRARALDREKPRAFLRETATLDAVLAEDGGVSGEAGPDRRGGMILRPIDDLCERRPKSLVAQIRRARFAARHEQAVESRAKQRVERGVGRCHPRLGRLAPDDAGEGEEVQVDGTLVRRA